MKVLLVGSLNTIFLYSYANIFKSKGYEVEVLNTSRIISIKSTDFNGYDLYKIQTKQSNKATVFKRLIAKFKLDTSNLLWFIYMTFFEKNKLNKSEQVFIEKIVSLSNYSLVFSFWGTTLRKELHCIKESIVKNGLDTKMIHSVSTYPIRYELGKKKNIYWLLLKRDSAYFNLFDGLILSGKIMEEVIVGYLNYNGDYIRMLDFFPASFFYNNAEKKNFREGIVFLGNVNFSERTLDNVAEDIISLADMGVEVWLQEPCDLIHKNIKTFKPFTLKEIADGKLSEFLIGFKATIVLYNNKNNLRMGTTYPTRFALGTLGRHKIYVPEKLFDAVESFKQEKEIEEIILFKTIAEVSGDFTKSQKYFIENNDSFSMDSSYNSNKLNCFIENVLRK